MWRRQRVGRHAASQAGGRVEDRHERGPSAHRDDSPVRKRRRRIAANQTEWLNFTPPARQVVGDEAARTGNVGPAVSHRRAGGAQAPRDLTGGPAGQGPARAAVEVDRHDVEVAVANQERRAVFVECQGLRISRRRLHRDGLEASSIEVECPDAMDEWRRDEELATVMGDTHRKPKWERSGVGATPKVGRGGAAACHGAHLLGREVDAAHPVVLAVRNTTRSTLRQTSPRAECGRRRHVAVRPGNRRRPRRPPPEAYRWRR